MKKKELKKLLSAGVFGTSMLFGLNVQANPVEFTNLPVIDVLNQGESNFTWCSSASATVPANSSVHQEINEKTNSDNVTQNQNINNNDSHNVNQNQNVSSNDSHNTTDNSNRSTTTSNSNNKTDVRSRIDSRTKNNSDKLQTVITGLPILQELMSTQKLQTKQKSTVTMTTA